MIIEDIKPIDIPQNAPKTTSIESIEAVENIITDIIKKKLSKHKKNFSKRFRWIIIPITLPNVKITLIQ